MITPAERVENGVEWLDEHVPGWLERVHIPPGGAFIYAYTGLDPDGPAPGDGYEFEALTAAWVARIGQLRAERGAA